MSRSLDCVRKVCLCGGWEADDGEGGCNDGEGALGEAQSDAAKEPRAAAMVAALASASDAASLVGEAGVSMLPRVMAIAAAAAAEPEGGSGPVVLEGSCRLPDRAAAAALAAEPSSSLASSNPDSSGRRAAAARTITSSGLRRRTLCPSSWQKLPAPMPTPPLTHGSVPEPPLLRG